MVLIGDARFAQRLTLKAKRVRLQTNAIIKQKNVKFPKNVIGKAKNLRLLKASISKAKSVKLIVNAIVELIDIKLLKNAARLGITQNFLNGLRQKMLSHMLSAITEYLVQIPCNALAVSKQNNTIIIVTSQNAGLMLNLFVKSVIQNSVISFR